MTTRLTRRDLMKLTAAGVAVGSMSGWIDRLAAVAPPSRKKACILLWMPGGASHIDTFDPKPGHKNGGPFKPVKTSVPGVVIGEHLPKVAAQMKRLAVIRSMKTREGDHSRATYNLKTGYLPLPAVNYPALGPLVAKELARADSPLPGCVSIAPSPFFGRGNEAGFLGPTLAPLVIGGSARLAGREVNPDTALKVEYLTAPADADARHVDKRLELLKEIDGRFARAAPGAVSDGLLAAYDRAARLMTSEARKAFDFQGEKDALRDAYGRNLFGQGCLLARRLVERGVPFVEVSLGGVNGGAFGWDTHNDNFNRVRDLCGALDAGWSALMKDLEDRGLLDSTLIVWMGEFGRTPVINRANGRDHFPNAWSTVLAGGGIKGGQVIGKTNEGGASVEERPVSVPDLLGTVCQALGIDPEKSNLASNGRPIRIVDKGHRPIREALAGA